MTTFATTLNGKTVKASYEVSADYKIHITSVNGFALGGGVIIHANTVARLKREAFKHYMRQGKV